MMLFPITPAYEKARKERDDLVKADDLPRDVLFFKQTVSGSPPLPAVPED